MARKKAKPKEKRASKKAPKSSRRARTGNLVLVATRKGAWLYQGDAARQE